MMKKTATTLLVLFAALALTAQDAPKPEYNRYSMRLKNLGDGSYELVNRQRYEALVPLDSIPDLLVPYKYVRDRVQVADYRGVEVKEFTYKTYPDYELKLFVDMAVSETPAPFVVFIHGGGWARGSAASNRDLSQYLAKQDGIAGVRIAYTFVGQPGANIQVTIQDVRDAVRFIQEHSLELNIDPSRFGFAGGSAGGHLAACGAMTVPGARVLVGVSGIYDLTDAGIIAKSKGERVAYFFDRDLGKLKEASPAHLIPDKDIPAALLIHGTGDIVVEYQQSVIFAVALRAKKAPVVELALYPYYDHGISSTGSDMKETTFLQMRDFIVKHIK